MGMRIRDALQGALGASTDIDDEKHDWASRMRRAARIRFPKPDASVGRGHWVRVRKALDTIVEHTNDVSLRSMMIVLAGLVRLCGDDRDWASPTGPVIGVSNRRILEEFAIAKTRFFGARALSDELSKLRVFRWLSDFRPTLNHRRSFYRNADGTIGGRGLSLLPLIMRLDELEALAALAKNGSVTRDLRQMARTDFAEDFKIRLAAIKKVSAEAMTLSKELAKARRRLDAATTEATRDRHYDTVRDLARKAVAILPRDQEKEELADKTPLEDSSKNRHGCRIQACTYKQNNEDSSFVDSLASPRSRNHRSAPRRIRTKDTAHCGLREAKFEPIEAPALFPACDHYLPAGCDMDALHRASWHLLRDTNIAPSAMAEAQKRFGTEVASVMVLVTVQHDADGDIRNTAGHYFQGMLSRAKRDELNLGATIHRRRDKAEARASGIAFGLRSLIGSAADERRTWILG